MRFIRPVPMISAVLSLTLLLTAGCDEGARNIPNAPGEAVGEAGELGEAGEGAEEAEGGGEAPAGGGEAPEGGGEEAPDGGGETPEGGGEVTEDECFEVDCTETGGVCVAGACVNADPCNDSVQCITGFICLDRTRKCIEDLCEGFECERGVCDPEVEDADLRCVEPQICGQDSDCLTDGWVCTDDGKCEEPCWLTDEETGEFLFECEEGSYCDASGHCLEDPDSCEADEDCPSSAVRHRVCGGGGVCDDSCALIGCVEGRCNPDSGHCEQPEVCAGSGECFGALVCIDGACTDPVDDPRGQCDEVECPAPQVCNEFGDCANPDECELDADCATGICNEDAGVCVNCQFDEDCPGNQLCLFGLACVENDACVDDNDCRGDRLCDVETGECAAGDCVPDRFEPEFAEGQPAIEGPGTAAEIGEGLFSGLTICGQDEDWYAVFLPAGSGLRVSIRHPLADGDLDLDIFDANNPEQPVDSSANFGVTTESAVYDLAEEDTWALIHVYDPGQDDVSISYDMSVEIVDGLACEDDFLDEALIGNSMDDAAFFGIGAIVDDVTICAGDADWYATDLDDAQTLLVDIDFDAARGDLVLNIVDDSGASVAEGVAREDGTGKSAQWTANGAGIFWISVAGADGNVANGYSLSATKFFEAGLAECEAPIVLERGVTYQGNTDDGGADHVSTCGGGSDGANDVVHSFTINKPSIVTIDVQPDGWDAIAYLRRNCNSVGSEIACADDPEVINALLDPGTYFVIVDAWAQGGGDYEIFWEIQDPICIPGDRGCVGNLAAICADDGSGFEPLGQCEGVCNEETGTCDVPDATCESPTALEDGVTFSGSTVGVSDDYDTGCSDPEAVSGDRVFSFTLEERGGLRVDFDSPEGLLSWSLRTSCRGPDSEFACNFAVGGEGLFILDAGQYFVIVDGIGVEGEFDLTVSTFDMGCDFFEDNQRCSPDEPDMLQLCAVDVNLEEITFWQDEHLCEHGCEDDHCIVDNDACEDGDVLVPNALTSGDTRGTRNDANPTCEPGADAGEVFHRIVLQDTIGVSLEIVDADFPAILHVREECDLQGSEVACALPVTFFGFIIDNARWVGVLEAGTYHVAVDGLQGTEGQYGLLFETFDPACAPGDPAQCDGDVLLFCSADGREVVELLCANGCDAENGECNVPNDECEGAAPLEFGDAVEDSLQGAGDDYEALACPFGGGDGPDHVYSIEVAQRGVVTATLDALTGSDFILYMRRTACDQAFLENECVDDNTQTPGLPRGVGEQIQAILEPGTYYIFVDTWGGLNAGDPGDYRLTVEFEEVICDPGATQCSEDGAGVEACIAGLEWQIVEDCADGCADGECIEEEGGDCEEPRPIEEFGVAYEGNSAGFEPVAQGSCQFGNSPVVVYTVDIDEDSWVTASLEGSGFDTVMFVRKDECDGGEEIACNDNAFGTLQSGVGLPVEGGTTLFIFVAGFNGQAGDFQLVVEAEPLTCWPGDRVCGADDQDGWLLECDGDGAEWLPVVECPHGCNADEAECDVPNDLCDPEDTPTIDAGEVVIDTTEFGTDDYDGTCNIGNANDNTYKIELEDIDPDAEDIYGVVVTLNADFDGYFYLRSDCGDRASEVACAEGGFGQSEWRGVLSEGTWYIVVDGIGFGGGNEGAYELTVDTYVPICQPGETICDGSIVRTCVDDGSAWRSFECPGACEVGAGGAAGCVVGNDTCDSAEELPYGQWISGDTRAANDDYRGSCAGEGPDVVYSFDVPVPEEGEFGWGVDLMMQWEEGTLPPVVYARSQCERAITEIEGACGLPANQFLEPVTLSQPLPAGGTYYFFVDAAEEFGIEPGEYAIHVDLYELQCDPGTSWCDDDDNSFNTCSPDGKEVLTEGCDPGFCGDDGCVLPGDSCELPELVEVDPLDDGGVSGVLIGGTTEGFSNTYQPTCGFSNGPDVIYELPVPEGAVTADVLVTALPFPDGFDTFVAVLDEDCDGGREIGCDDDDGSTRRSWAPQVDVAGNASIFVVVTGFAGASGEFDLEVVFQGEPPPPPDPCEGLIDLVSDEQAVGDTSLSADTLDTACNPGLPGADDLYTFTVESPSWATVDLGIEIAEQCADTCGPGLNGDWADDGFCDEDFFCPFGTDCADCGPSEAPAWTGVMDISAGECPEQNGDLYCPFEFGPQHFEGVLEAGIYTVQVTGPGGGEYTLDLALTPGDCFDEFAVQCDGDTVQACNLDTFTWEDGELCANGCVDGLCQFECEPIGVTLCDGDLLLTCDDNNEWDDGQACAFGCDAGECLPECFPGGITECQGDTPRWCDEETLEWVAADDPCANGCVNGSCVPDNDRCGGDLLALQSGDVIVGDTTGSSNDTSGTCAFGNAPDNFYAFTVEDEASDGVQIALGPEPGFQGFTYIQGACGERGSEVACSTPADLGGEPVLPPRGEDVIGNDGNDDCALAEVTEIALGGSSGLTVGFAGSTVDALGDDSDPNCTFANSVDVGFAFTVDSPVEADIRMVGNYDTIMTLHAGGCSDDTMIACNDDGFGGIGTSSFTVQLEAGVTYYIQADGWFEDGDFEISMDLRNLDVPDTRFYQLAPGPYWLVVDGWGAVAEARRGSYTLWFNTFDAVCDPGTSWCDDDGNLRHCNESGDAELPATVCPYGCDDGVLECQLAPNDMCAAAEVVDDAAEWGDSRFATNGFDAPIDALCSAAGTDLWYALSLDADCTLVTASVVPDIDNEDDDSSLAAQAFDSTLFLLTGCPADDGEYLTCADNDGQGGTESIQTELAAGDYTLVVDGFGQLDAAPFLLEVTEEDCPPEDVPAEGEGEGEAGGGDL